MRFKERHFKENKFYVNLDSIKIDDKKNVEVKKEERSFGDCKTKENVDPMLLLLLGS